MTKFELIDEIEIELIDSFDVYLKVMVNMVMNVLREINEDVSELTDEIINEIPISEFKREKEQNLEVADVLDSLIRNRFEEGGNLDGLDSFIQEKK